MFGDLVLCAAVLAHIVMTHVTLLLGVDEKDETAAAAQTEVVIEVLLSQQDALLRLLLLQFSLGFPDHAYIMQIIVFVYRIHYANCR